jgi:hypothetical protein
VSCDGSEEDVKTTKFELEVVEGSRWWGIEGGELISDWVNCPGAKSFLEAERASALTAGPDFLTPGLNSSSLHPATARAQHLMIQQWQTATQLLQVQHASGKSLSLETVVA